MRKQSPPRVQRSMTFKLCRHLCMTFNYLPNFLNYLSYSVDTSLTKDAGRDGHACLPDIGPDVKTSLDRWNTDLCL